MPVTNIVNKTVSLLENCLETIDESESYVAKRIDFIMEQLKLVMKPKYSRHYSPNLIVWSYLVFSTSPAAYNQLLNDSVLSLPSISTLRKVTRKVDQNTGLSNLSYLQLRCDKLNEFEKHVVLIMDEIYVAKRIEYASGNYILRFYFAVCKQMNVN